MAGVPASSHGSTGIGDVAVTGTPQSGYTVIASSASAAAWAAASAGALTLLSTTTVTGSDATIDVSGISQAYNDLILVLIARGSNAGGSSDALLMRLNNDSGANYSGDLCRTNGATPSGVQTLDGTSWRVSESLAAVGGTTLANSFCVYEIDLLGYASTSWLKQVTSQGANSPRDVANQIVPEVFSGVWLSTAAITRVTLFGSTAAALVVGSQLRIYGRL